MNSHKPTRSKKPHPNAEQLSGVIHDNIRKTIIFLLSTNLGEVAAVFAASLMGITVLGPSHLLWINLITDSFPALALGMEPAEPGIMRRGPRDVDAGVFSGLMWVDCLVDGLAIGALTIASYLLGAGSGDAGRGMTMAFLTLSMLETLQAASCRSLRQSLLRLPRQNGWLWAGLALSVALTYAAIGTPLAQVFGFAPLDARGYGVALGLAALIIPVTELTKLVMRRVAEGA